jgi:heat shock protein HslJ
MKFNWVTLTILISLPVFLASCFKEEATNLQIKGTEWILETLNGVPPIEGSNITLRFSDETLSGFAGCNRYGGKYTTLGSDKFTLTETEITLELCQTPVGVVEQENAYLKALRGAIQYRIADNLLKIENPEEKISLVFQRRKEVQVNPAKLVGTAWTLVSWNNHRYNDKETEITIGFNGKEIRGKAGCREYIGPYEAKGDEIIIPMLEMIGETEVCSDELIRQEGEYTTSLGWVRNYRLDGSRLELLTERGETLVFISSDSEH